MYAVLRIEFGFQVPGLRPPVAPHLPVVQRRELGDGLVRGLAAEQVDLVAWLARRGTEGITMHMFVEV